MFGKSMLSQTVGTSALVIPLEVADTGFSTRLKAMGDLFQEFRFKKIVLKLHPSSTAAFAKTSYAVGYSKANASNAPTNISDLYQLTASRYINLNDTVPQILTLNPSSLGRGERTWYKTNTIGEIVDRQQGVLYIIADTAASLVNIEVGFQIQFRGSTVPSID